MSPLRSVHDSKESWLSGVANGKSALTYPSPSGDSYLSPRKMPRLLGWSGLLNWWCSCLAGRIPNTDGASEAPKEFLSTFCTCRTWVLSELRTSTSASRSEPSGRSVERVKSSDTVIVLVLKSISDSGEQSAAVPTPPIICTVGSPANVSTNGLIAEKQSTSFDIC